MSSDIADKLSHKLADKIAKEIILKNLPEGYHVGKEVDLLEKFGISRASYREAVRILEWKGVAEAVPGPTGGLFVTKATDDTCVNIIRDYIDLSGTPRQDVMEARRILEAKAIQLAAQNIDDDTIQVLRGVVREHTVGLSKLESTMKVFNIFRVIYSQSNNPILKVLIEPLNFVCIDYMDSSRWSDEKFKKSARHSWIAICNLVDEIISGDDIAAVSALLRYLNIVSDHFAQDENDSRELKIYPEWYNTSKNKLAQNLIYQIRNDVIERQIKPFELIGSSDSIMKRYNVGRPIFREAARIMELVGIVEVRKGRGGGLIAMKPSPENTISAVVLFLESVPNVNVNHILELRSALEEFSARKAAALKTKTEVEELKEALRSHKNSKDGRALVSASISIQNIIGRMARNQVVVIYARILLSCTSFRPDPEILASKAWDHKDIIYCSLKGVVDAIVDGDSSLAKRRMREHRIQTASLFHSLYVL